MLFSQQTPVHSWITLHCQKRSTVCNGQDLEGSTASILQYVTLTLDVCQVCHRVSRCV